MIKGTVRLGGICIVAAMAMVASQARAGIVYQDSFLRTGDLAGSTPAPIDSGSATWAANTGGYTVGLGSATVATQAGSGTYNTSNAFLPYSPSTIGGTSTLTATLTPTTNSGDWLALGFTASNPTNSAFYGGGVNAQVWALYEGDGGGQAFNGGGLTNGGGAGTTPAAPGTPDTLTLTLNSSTGAFTISDSLGVFANSSFKSGTLTPTQVSAIQYVGFAQYQTQTGTISAFSVTSTVPEPATCGLLVAGAGLLLRRRASKR